MQWTGYDNFADALQSDVTLTGMLKEVLLKVGQITIDPLDDHVRIYGRWVHKEYLALHPAMFEIVNRIALHIKTIVEIKD